MICADTALNARHEKPKWVMSQSVKVFVCAFWVVTIILPLLAMLSSVAGVDVGKVITSRSFTRALRQSVTVSSVATIISVSLAGLLAWCTTRTAIKYKSAFMMVLSLPMLIPSISHGMGLVILLGSNGILRNMFSLGGTIYGFWGIVIGSVLYSFPVAYLMLADVLKYEDSTPYEAAEVLGISKFHRFTAITLPYLRKPLISVLFAIFTMIVTDYGVPLMIGGKYYTLPVVMYQDVIGLLDFGKGSVIGIVLLFPALIACVLDIVNRDSGNTSYITKPFSPKPSIARDVSAYTICALFCLLTAFPIVSFSYISFVNKYPIDMSMSLDNALRAFQMNAGTYLINSLFIAVLVSFVGVLVAVFMAYITARMKSRFSRVVHLLSISSLAIPGIVLGLSYVLFFKGSFIYGTFAILILVNTMHFFSSPYLMIYNTFGKLNENLEAVGTTLGISRLRIIKDVLLPQSKGTILEMGVYFFVNSMMTISAVSFLATVASKPLALMITQFEGQMQLECAAFISLIILLVNMMVKGIVYIVKRVWAVTDSKQKTVNNLMGWDVSGRYFDKTPV